MEGNGVTMMTGKTRLGIVWPAEEKKRRSGVRVRKKRTDRVPGDEDEKNGDDTHRGSRNFRRATFGGGINL